MDAKLRDPWNWLEAADCKIYLDSTFFEPSPLDWPRDDWDPIISGGSASSSWSTGQNGISTLRRGRGQNGLLVTNGSAGRSGKKPHPELVKVPRSMLPPLFTVFRDSERAAQSPVALEFETPYCTREDHQSRACYRTNFSSSRRESDLTRATPFSNYTACTLTLGEQLGMHTLASRTSAGRLTIKFSPSQKG